MTSKNDIQEWLYREQVRLNKRIGECRASSQESTSLLGSLLTVQKLIKLIREDKVNEQLGTKNG